MDTVLVGGLSVVAFIVVLYYCHNQLNKADLTPTTKRIGNIALMLLVLGAAVIAIDWHSATWLASR